MYIYILYIHAHIYIYIYMYTYIYIYTMYIYWSRCIYILSMLAIATHPNNHQACKLQPWSSFLNASSNRNVLIIRIIIHGFRHRASLRTHPRCCHRLLVCLIKSVDPDWEKLGFQQFEFFGREFRILEPRSNKFRGKKPICCVLRVGGVGWLVGLMGYFSACMSR